MYSRTYYLNNKWYAIAVLVGLFIIYMLFNVKLIKASNKKEPTEDSKSITKNVLGVANPATAKKDVVNEKEYVKENGKTFPDFEFDEPLDENVADLKNYTTSCGMVKPTDTTMFNKVWHLASNGEEYNVLVFGAYYDDRDPNQTYLRLFGVSDSPKDAAIYCHIWYPGLNDPIISQSEILDTGRGLNYKKHHQERLYSCKIPISNPEPEHVSIVFKQCEKSYNLIPVHIPQREQIHEFGICMVVAYGAVNPIKIVEWIELNKLLGVGEINIVDSNITQQARDVLQHYSDAEGYVKLKPVAPAVDNWCYWCQKLTAIPGLNDCMYRNMYRYKYTIVIDFDEVIVPRQTTKLSELIKFLSSSQKEEAFIYTFRNTYFFLDFPSSANAESFQGISDITMCKRFTRIEPSTPGQSPKSIVRPTKCLVMQNHYCMHRLPKAGLAVNVPADLALSHHYKNCSLTHLSQIECKEIMQTSQEDFVLSKYCSNIDKTVTTKLKELGLV